MTLVYERVEFTSIGEIIILRQYRGVPFKFPRRTLKSNYFSVYPRKIKQEMIELMSVTEVRVLVRDMILDNATKLNV